MTGFGLAVLVSLLVGCKSNRADESASTATAPSAASTTTTQTTTAETRGTTTEPVPAPVQPKRPELRSGELWAPDAVRGAGAADLAAVDSKFYFDFDQAIVKRAGFAALAQHAAYLSANPGVAIRLEGHADERGTREYNLALGERRANAVGAYLRAQGVGAGQVEVISYGEEKPASLGHDEASWAQNRRVELIYR